jgi:hypothetical protein
MFLSTLMMAAVLAAASADDPAIKDFNDRVQQYWDLHKKAEAAAPPIDKKKEDPAMILAHEQGLMAGIRMLRKNAKEGEILTPAIQRVLAATIKQQLSSGTGKQAREIILGEGNPRNPESAAKVELAVNAKYPSTAPVSTVPPSVLLALPKLPQDLQYRFVGRHLILYDEKANLIVDIFRNAIR